MSDPAQTLVDPPPGATSPRPAATGERSRGLDPLAAATARAQVRATFGAAILAVLAHAAARGFGPAIAGVWVGADHVVGWAEVVSAIAAQAFALVGLAAALGLTVLLARDEGGVSLRALAVGVSGLVAVAMATAMFVVLPELSGLVAGVAAALFALAAAAVAMRAPPLRWLGLILATAAAGGAVRMASFGVLDVLGPDALGHWTWLVTAGSTTAVSLDVLLLVVCLGWLVGPRPRPIRVALAILGLGLALGWAWAAVRGAQPDATGLEVYLQRALHRLVVGPPGLAPHLGRSMVEATAVTIACVALVRPAPSRLGATVVALALVGRGALEAPACALALHLSALALAVGTSLSGSPRPLSPPSARSRE